MKRLTRVALALAALAWVGVGVFMVTSDKAVAQISVGGPTTIPDLTVTNDLTVGGVVLAPNGSASAPSYSFSNDTDTGIYSSPVAIRFAVGGSQQVAIAANTLAAPSGTISAAGISFLADLDTGLYVAGTNGLGLTAGGNDLGQWYVATGTLTATQVRTLFTTPVTVIAAPGSGKSLIVESVQFHLDYGGTVFDSVDAGEDIRVQYVTSDSEILSPCDSSTCVIATQTSDSWGAAVGHHSSGNAAYRLRDNDGVELQILIGNWATTDDDSDGNSPMHYLIRYRVVTLDLS